MSKFSSSRPGPYPRTGYPGPIGVNGVYNPDVIYDNPTSAVPGPGAVENRGYWNGPETGIVWALIQGPGELDPTRPEIGGLENVVPVYKASWKSPVFDLRPDLKASASTEYQAAYPIFRGGAFGAGASLQIMIRSRANFGGAINRIAQWSGTEVWSQEAASLTDPLSMVTITPIPAVEPITTLPSGAVDLTAAFFQGGDATLFYFSPPANPVRYWSVELFFKWHERELFGQPNFPNLSLQGVCE